MEKHYELTSEFKVNVLGIKLFRIRCIKKVKNIEVGELGGWIEKESNLSGNAWVSGNAKVFGDAQVYDNAKVFGNVRVYGDAQVYDNACVSGNAWVSGDADYCCFQKFGSRGGTMTVFREKDNMIKINCGYFSGSLKEFEEAVEFTHGDNEYGLTYKSIIEVIKLRFNIKQ